MKGTINPEHKRIVEAGGGEYVPGMLGDLVLFNSPLTGSTLALSERDLTAEAVHAKIEASDKTFPPHQWRQHARVEVL